MQNLSESFWKTIDLARASSENGTSAAPPALEQVLQGRTSEEIAEFEKEFYQALILLNKWEIWGAGYLITGGMSDDGFHYFRSWLIGKGKQVFDIALSDPDELGQFISQSEVEDSDGLDNEGLEYVAIDILEARGVTDDPRDDVDGFADDYPQGEVLEEEDLPAKFRKLNNRFG